MSTINEQIAAADNWRKAVELAALTLGIAKDDDRYFILMALGRSCYLIGRSDETAIFTRSMDKIFGTSSHHYPVATGKEIDT